MAVLDLDHFKAVNDGFGHTTGDRVLEAVGEVLRNELRETDLVGRLGGEEFAVLLPGSAIDDAVAVLERVRKALESRCFETEAGAVNVTVSIGVAACDPAQGSIQNAFAAADHALYEAKHNGRNRIVADGG